jgi:hypothetical protein
MSCRSATLFAIVGLVLFTVPAGAQSSQIFGVYGQCMMACRYLKINADHTFEEVLNGDLFNGQRKKGTWHFEDKTRIRAQSQKPDAALKVNETSGSDLNFRITVVDMAGAVLPGTRVSGMLGSKLVECTTGDDGSCEISKVSQFDVQWNRFKGTHSVTSPTATRFQVNLTYEQMDTVIDEVWMIKAGRLYIELDGRFYDTDPLTKVTARRARKLFPVS